MPQDGSNNYQYPPGTPGIPNQTIESEAYNTFLDDLVVNDLNIARPVHRGGTGASTASEALVNLSGEKATQLVTNYDVHIWLPGSFRSSNATGQGAPVDGHAFAGICYINEPYIFPLTNANVIIEARDENDTTAVGRVYVREKKTGVWGAWVEQVGGSVELLALADARYMKLHNRIVNGAMQVSQENGNTAGSILAFYGADQWRTGGVSAGTITTQRVQSTTVNGSRDRYRVTITVADAALAAGDALTIVQIIEGNRVADFLFGGVSARQIILRFGWRSPAGTYAISIRNSAADRSYLAEFIISAGQANIDTEQTIIIPGDQSGTWLTDTGVGMILTFCIAAGTIFHGTANTWNAGSLLATASTTNGMATLGNVFELFDVGLYLDVNNTGVAPKWEMPDPILELYKCQRYFEIINPTLKPKGGGWGTVYTSTVASMWSSYTAIKRVAPTVSSLTGTYFIHNITAASAGTAAGADSTLDKVWWDVTGMTAASLGNPVSYNGSIIANARL